MNIGIIIHSVTGNTYSVGMRLRDSLTVAGHTVQLERVKSDGPVKPRDTNVKLTCAPEIAGYEAVIIGAPVHAFSLSPVMQAYLNQVDALDDKPVAGLVTMFFPFAWMGGNRALRQLRQICQAKGARLRGMGAVNWCRPTREAQIKALTNTLSAAIQSSADHATPPNTP